MYGYTMLILPISHTLLLATGEADITQPLPEYRVTQCSATIQHTNWVFSPMLIYSLNIHT